MFSGFCQFGRRLAWALTAVAAVGALAWLGWGTRMEGRIAFLADKAPAHWIVYPTAPDLMPHSAPEMETVFRQTVILPAAPTNAVLRVAGFRTYAVSLNGRSTGNPKVRGRNWKQADVFDVSDQLRAGTNEIQVAVQNSYGPPALWLSLEADGLNWRSDEEWDASQAGAAWHKARLGSKPKPAVPGSPDYGGVSALAGFRGRWPVLLGFAVLSALACVLLRRGRGALPWVLLAAAWLALFSNNVGVLPALTGYDVDAHIAYIRFIQEHHALPRAGAGWETFQPPLYYLASATLLEALSLQAADPGGVVALRGLGLAIGITHLALIWLVLRLLFPESQFRQKVGLLLAAALPPVLYLSQYTTNESLAAMLVTASVWACLRILKLRRSSWGAYALLGFCLGAAMLTKVTAVLALPPIFLALLWDTDSSHSLLPTVGRLALVAGLGLLLCGWHYGRVWLDYGTPFLGVWDPRLGFTWWQDDGYRTSAYYLRFGQALAQPWFSSTTSFADGIYTSLWGDGLLGGASHLDFGPPWNYDLMAVGYWLALAPTLAVLLGGLLAVRQFLQRPSAEWLLMLGLGFAVALAVLYLSMAVPYYCATKAFYGLSALASFCAFGAWGLEALCRGRPVWRSVVLILFGVWAINSYASFWIARSAAPALVSQAQFLFETGKGAAAADLLKERLRTDPQAAPVRALLVRVLTGMGNVTEAEKEARLLLRDRPDDGAAELALASCLVGPQQTDEALGHARRAIELSPGSGAAYEQLATLLVDCGRYQEAEPVSREGLRVAPFSSSLRRALGMAVSAGDPAEAVRQYELALRLKPDWPEVLNNLAWIRATHARPELRNGSEAVRLAERACQVTSYKYPVLAGTLAAAYAEAGRYEAAAEAANKARELALEQGQTDLAARNQKLAELFRSGRTYREGTNDAVEAGQALKH